MPNWRQNNRDKTQRVLQKMKLDKYIALFGHVSRRKAAELIEQGRVVYNGKQATFSSKYKIGDSVEVDGKTLEPTQVENVCVLYNKPKGIICTSEKIPGNIVDAVNHPQKIYPAGRLDKDSEGLILLTNMGELINRITHPQFEHEKEYLVTLNLPVRKKFLDEVRQGMHIGGEVYTDACEVWPEPGTKRLFRIVLKQGLNRQIRKMCNAHNYQVLKLQRVRIMHMRLDNLKTGEWRTVEGNELQQLLVATGLKKT